MIVDGLNRVDPWGVALPLGDAAEALLAGEAVHRELRSALPVDYAGFVGAMIAEGARLTQLVDEGEVRALAVWRTFQTTYCGRRFEIDDLVTAAAHRSRRYGAMLLGALEAEARRLGCETLTLNSAVHRRDAHRFYFRERYVIAAFHFGKTLAPI